VIYRRLVGSLGQCETELAGSEQRFNIALVKSIEDSIEVVLGRATFPAYHVYAFLGLSREEVPAHLHEFFNALTQLFGQSGEVLARRTVRKLYAELALSLVLKPNDSMVECIENGKKMFLKQSKDRCRG
jgi:hypothetical protein